MSLFHSDGRTAPHLSRTL